jgi:hypothetical protein
MCRKSGQIASFSPVLSGTPIAKLWAGNLRHSRNKKQEPSTDKTMEIRFISSLTAEDEELFAPAVLKAASALLDQLPIAYTIRIETTGAQVYQHTHVVPDPRELGLDPSNGFKASAHLLRGSAT